MFSALFSFVRKSVAKLLGAGYTLFCHFFVIFISLGLERVSSVFPSILPFRTSMSRKKYTLKAVNELLLPDISTLYLNEKFSDVVLVKDDERIFAHKVRMLQFMKFVFMFCIFLGYSCCWK